MPGVETSVSIYAAFLPRGNLYIGGKGDTMDYGKEKAERAKQAGISDEIKISVSKGQKEAIQKHAQKHGEELVSFILRAVEETMERDNDKPGQFEGDTEVDFGRLLEDVMYQFEIELKYGREVLDQCLEKARQQLDGQP